jgi:hypothetical protein
VKYFEKYKLEYRNHLEKIEDTRLPKREFYYSLGTEIEEKLEYTETMIRQVLSLRKGPTGLILNKAESRITTTKSKPSGLAN